MVLFLVFFNQGVWRTFQREREIRRLEKELTQAHEQVLETRKRIDALQSDKIYVDVLTQKELGYLKSDEMEIRFVSAAPQDGRGR